MNIRELLSSGSMVFVLMAAVGTWLGHHTIQRSRELPVTHEVVFDRDAGTCQHRSSTRLGPAPSQTWPLASIEKFRETRQFGLHAGHVYRLELELRDGQVVDVGTPTGGSDALAHVRALNACQKDTAPRCTVRYSTQWSLFNVLPILMFALLLCLPMPMLLYDLWEDWRQRRQRRQVDRALAADDQPRGRGS